MANNYKIKMKDIQNKYKFKIFCAGYEYDDTELRNAINQRALITEAGRYIELELNPNTYVLTAKLRDKNNNVISTSTPIDLPLESMIVDCDYDATTKSLIITLQNGNTTSIPLGDLISGLATEEDLEEVDAKVDANIEKISDLENELNQYKTIYNVLPKIEGNGESITLDNTGESILKLSPRGQCKQDSTSISGGDEYDSPSPDYPQEIHETSGDNKVYVKGKNLFSGYTKGKGISGTTGAEVASDANGAVSDFIPLKIVGNTKYYLWGLPTTISTFVAGYNKDKQFLGRTGGVTTGALTLGTQFFTAGTPQGTGDIEFVRVYTYKISTSPGTIDDIDNAKVMLEAGTTATTYEPYNGDTYELDLGVKNLFTSSIYNDIDVSGNAQLQDNGYYEVKFNSNKTLMEGQFKANTQYTISCMAYGSASGNSGVIGFNYTDNTSETKGINQTTPYQYTITSSAGKTIKNIKITYGSQNTTYIKDLQLEEGIVAHSYSEYGIEPIKMRGIGSYEDYFVRNSGKKNLINIKGQQVKRESASYSNIKTLNDTFEYNIATTIAGYLGFVIPVEVGKSYTLSYSYLKGLIHFIQLDDVITEVGSNYGNQVATGYSFTATKPYVGIWLVANTDGGSYSKVVNLMLNEGTIALPYEPYETGKWCKYNAIKEVVLDGETAGLKFTSAEISRNKRFSLILSDVLVQSYLLNVESKSNNFIYNTDVYRDGADTIGFIINSTQLYVRFGSTSELDTITKANAWLSTHNTQVDYILASPYLSLIESEKLQSQLDALEKALGKDGQTNISQVNNDAPFKIYASAVKDLSSL